MKSFLKEELQVFWGLILFAAVGIGLLYLGVKQPAIFLIVLLAIITAFVYFLNRTPEQSGLVILKKSLFIVLKYFIIIVILLTAGLTLSALLGRGYEGAPECDKQGCYQSR